VNGDENTRHHGCVGPLDFATKVVFHDCESCTVCLCCSGPNAGRCGGPCHDLRHRAVGRQIGDQPSTASSLESQAETSAPHGRGSHYRDAERCECESVQFAVAAVRLTPAGRCVPPHATVVRRPALRQPVYVGDEARFVADFFSHILGGTRASAAVYALIFPLLPPVVRLYRLELRQGNFLTLGAGRSIIDVSGTSGRVRGCESFKKTRKLFCERGVQCSV